MIRGYADTRQVFIADGIELMPGMIKHIKSYYNKGFCWGNNSTSTKTLALAILLIFADEPKARWLYADFAKEILEPYPSEKDFYFSPDDVRTWLARKIKTR